MRLEGARKSCDAECREEQHRGGREQFKAVAREEAEQNNEAGGSREARQYREAGGSEAVQ